jgi:hypothetical protein
MKLGEVRKVYTLRLRFIRSRGEKVAQSQSIVHCSEAGAIEHRGAEMTRGRRKNECKESWATNTSNRASKIVRFDE